VDTQRDDSICIMTNVKLEERYLNEWITYHAHLGVSQFYLYDNNDDERLIHTALDSCPYKERVTIHYMPGPYVNQRGTEHWLATHKSTHRAVIFMDVDEFIVLHKHKDLHELLHEKLYPYGGALTMNWLLFGDNGLTTYDPRPVTERFTMRQSCPNHHVKSIACCEDLTARIFTHGVRVREGTIARDTNGRHIPDIFNDGGPTDLIQLNHYFCKTIEEWRIKQNKGHCDWEPGSRRPDSDFNRHNFNEVYDGKAMEFYRAIQKSEGV
jgi:hypothetical protein